MNEAIIAAMIAAAASIVCQIMVTGAKERRDDQLRLVRQQKLDDEIEQLKKHVTEHNNYAKLFSEQTKALTELSADIRVMKNDVKYIKEGRFNNDGTP